MAPLAEARRELELSQSVHVTAGRDWGLWRMCKRLLEYCEGHESGEGPDYSNRLFGENYAKLEPPCELEPCPHCQSLLVGMAMIAVGMNHIDHYFVRCDLCHMQGPRGLLRIDARRGWKHMARHANRK
jgi:hypothetical protein